MKWFRSREREEECRTDPLPFSDEDEAMTIYQDRLVIVIVIKRYCYMVQGMSLDEFSVFKLNELFPVDPKDEAQMEKFKQAYGNISNWTLRFDERENREVRKRIAPFLKMRNISL